MWTSRPSATALTSIPGVRSMPAGRAASSAASQPAVVPWSVMLMVKRPALRAFSTSSGGDSAPSEAVVCKWRSITAGAACGRKRPTLDAEGRPAAARRLGVRVLDRESAAGDVVDEIDLRAAQVAGADRIDQQLDAVGLDDRVGRRVPLALVDHQAVLKARAAAALDEDAQPGFGLVLFRQQFTDLGGRGRRDIDHLYGTPYA